MDKNNHLLQSSIEKCETAAFRARGHAADLRHNGVDGETIGALISECQQALEYAIMFQAYVNASN